MLSIRSTNTDHDATARRSIAGRWFVAVAALTTLYAVAADEGQAASGGRLGASSAGSMTISLYIPPRVDVAGAGEVQLSSTALNGGRVEQPLCVSGTGSPSYEVAAYGSGEAGAFTMEGRQGPAVPYDVSLRTPGDANPTNLDPGAHSGSYVLPGSEACLAGSGSAVVIQLPADSAAGPTPLTGALILVVKPE